MPIQQIPSPSRKSIVAYLDSPSRRDLEEDTPKCETCRKKDGRKKAFKCKKCELIFHESCVSNEMSRGKHLACKTGISLCKKCGDCRLSCKLAKLNLEEVVAVIDELEWTYRTRLRKLEDECARAREHNRPAVGPEEKAPEEGGSPEQPNTADDKEKPDKEYVEIFTKMEERISFLEGRLADLAGDTSDEMALESSAPKTSTGASKPSTARRPKKASTTREQCFFYRNGTCRFGDKCDNEHRPMCQRFATNGNRVVNGGCNKGPSCRYMHPVACKSALHQSRCDKLECRFFHPASTARPHLPPPPVPLPVLPPPPPPADFWYPPGVRQQHRPRGGRHHHPASQRDQPANPQRTQQKPPVTQPNQKDKGPPQASYASVAGTSKGGSSKEKKKSEN